MKRVNSQQGTMWITDESINKKIKKEQPIPDGWRRGRVNVLSEEHKEKLRNADINIEKRKETMLKRYGSMQTDNMKKALKKYHSSLTEEKVSQPWEKKSNKYRRVQVLQEQNEKCLHCGIDSWNGNKIVLELDHINGDNQNNDRENLRFLCPNCHSQTPTFRKGWKKNKGI